jgi:hypothetical protein
VDSGNENFLLKKGFYGLPTALSLILVFTGVLKLYLRDGQRATCDRGHAQVARDLGRKLHVFSTEEPMFSGGCEKHLQSEFLFLEVGFRHIT